MKVLELFAGSRSFGKASEELGFKVFSTDIIDYENIDYVCDILDFDITKIPFKPDIIWASPPCTTFSIASCSTHWTPDKKPKTEKCLKGIEIVKKTLEIIKHFKPKFYFIENPRGILRKLDVVKGLQRTTVTYCQYGDTRMKPTDIWTNNLQSIFNPNGWKPKAICKNGDSCHISAPRGSKTGTQGIKGSYLRSKVPDQLCKEILETVSINK